MQDPGLSTMTVDLHAGESFSLAGATVQFVHKSGRLARLRVIAPRDLQIKKNVGGAGDSQPTFRGKHGSIEPA